MKYLYSKNEHYNFFIKNEKNNRLDIGLKLLPSSKFIKINEIYNSEINTDYNCIKDYNEYKSYVFKTNSNIEYRLDLFIIYEVTINKRVNHISFTLSNIEWDDEQYENLTNYNETIELLNRIRFIINDLVNKNKILNYFCIGGSDLKEKNSIYKYFLKTVIGESGFEKINTESYSTGWGLFFKI